MVETKRAIRESRVSYEVEVMVGGGDGDARVLDEDHVEDDDWEGIIAREFGNVDVVEKADAPRNLLQLHKQFKLIGAGDSVLDIGCAPDKIKGGHNGDVATDSYHRYEEDIQLLKKLGVDSYCFSISWSRILPDGTGRVYPEEVKYYNKLINKLRENGITPYVTLFHWDVPQALDDKYGGFLNSKIANDFATYAKVCFKEFGDRVSIGSLLMSHGHLVSWVIVLGDMLLDDVHRKSFHTLRHVLRLLQLHKQFKLIGAGDSVLDIGCALPVLGFRWLVRVWGHWRRAGRLWESI